MSLQSSEDKEPHCNNKKTHQAVQFSGVLHLPGDWRHKPSGLIPYNLLRFGLYVWPVMFYCLISNLSKIYNV